MMVVMGMNIRIVIIAIIPNWITNNGIVDTLWFLACSNVILKFKTNIY